MLNQKYQFSFNKFKLIYDFVIVIMYVLLLKHVTWYIQLNPTAPKIWQTL